MDCALAVLEEHHNIVELDLGTMANAAEVNTKVETLKERVNSHITFVWAVCTALALWLGSISLALFNMNGTLNSIKATQQDLHARVTTIEASTNPHKALEDIAKAPPKEFAKLLPAVRKLAQQSPSAVRLDEPQLQQIAYKLRTADEFESNYWPAVFGFISFSSGRFASVVPGSDIPNLILSNNYGLPAGTVN